LCRRSGSTLSWQHSRCSFHNWLGDARDWSISRARFWGTPIPVWRSDDWEEIVVIGSVEELEALTGEKVTDLHRDFIDHLTIPSKMGKGVLRRIEDVFDCWFESGSMPYAQQHYPFENKDKFEGAFPADFIAEGLDQTRGWFYTLLVLSTCLFDKPPFKNLICNGLVLAADGKKMSKRLKNYPDPTYVINSYGADALRIYLINSPVVRAEPLRFKEEGVRDVIKDIFLPWFNAFRFFNQSVKRAKLNSATAFAPLVKDGFIPSANVMDRWIQASSAALIKFVREEMGAYRLYTVVPQLLRFVEDLTNWYVRTNRRRLKGDNGDEDRNTALSVLFQVLYTLSVAMAPFTPFFSEYLYQNLKKLLPSDAHQGSVHFLMYPEVVTEALDEDLVKKVARMQTLIERGRCMRDRRKISLKTPTKGLVLVHPDPQYRADIEDLTAYITEELNLQKVETRAEAGDAVTLKALPDSKVLGKKLGKAFKDVAKKIEQLSSAELRALEASGTIEILGQTLTADELKVPLALSLHSSPRSLACLLGMWHRLKRRRTTTYSLSSMCDSTRSSWGGA
jgi:isoleucyl-tRNA synthetase